MYSNQELDGHLMFFPAFTIYNQSVDNTQVFKLFKNTSVKFPSLHHVQTFVQNMLT